MLGEFEGATGRLSLSQRVKTLANAEAKSIIDDSSACCLQPNGANNGTTFRASTKQLPSDDASLLLTRVYAGRL